MIPHTRLTLAIFGFGLVLATLAVSRAQPPAPEPTSAKEKLRERLVTLRTEVEVLGIEHDADKDDLVKRMNSLRKLKREGLDKDTLEEIGERGIRFGLAKAEGEFPQILEKTKAAMALRGELKDFESAEKEFKSKEMDGKAYAQLLVKLVTEGREKILYEEIAKKTVAFTHSTRELNRKSLELDEVESRYKVVK